jgi:hypothetical protein
MRSQPPRQHRPYSRVRAGQSSRLSVNSQNVPIDAQIKHLEFIQSIISRLATNSFLAKGWALTVAGAIDAFAANHLNPWIAFVGLTPVAAFWWLDAFFLRGERLFRCLYDDVRRPDTSVELFSMSTMSYRSDTNTAWRKVTFSSTLRVFYGVLLAIGLAIFIASIVHNSRPAHAARTTSARWSSASPLQGSFGGQILPIRSSYQRGTK